MIPEYVFMVVFLSAQSVMVLRLQGCKVQQGC